MQNMSLRELAYLFLDEEMDAETLASFEARIKACRETQRTTTYCRQLLMLVRQRCPRQAAPPQLRIRIRTVLKQHHDSDH